MAPVILPKDEVQKAFVVLAKEDPAMASKIKTAQRVIGDLGFTMETAKAAMKLALDISPSTSGLYASGVMQSIVNRYLAVALFMDDNQNVDVIAFDRSVRTNLPSVTLQNYRNYVQRYIEPLLPSGDGTHYAPAIKALAKGLEVNKAVGLCGFFTDGQNFDPDDATQAIIEASQKPLFFEFCGIGRNPREFAYLQNLDKLDDGRDGKLRAIDNAGFFQLSDVNITDDLLMRLMLQEFAAIDPKSGARTPGVLAYPEKCREAGILTGDFLWNGKLADLPRRQRRGWF